MVIVLSLASLLLFNQDRIFALDCIKAPEQLSSEWKAEINIAVGKICFVKAAELKGKVKTMTKDLLDRLPDAQRVYLEQMMFSAYCSALRDDKTMKESEKARLLKIYRAEVINTIRRSRKAHNQALIEMNKTAARMEKHQKASMDAIVAYNDKELKGLDRKLALLYSQEVGITDEDSKKWARNTIENSRTFKKDKEKLDKSRKEYNALLSKNIIAKVYNLYDYIISTVDSRVMAFQELNPKVKYEKGERFTLFNEVSSQVNHYIFRTVIFPNGNKILLKIYPGKLKQGTVSTCPSLEFIEIIEQKVMQSFSISPDYGERSILILEGGGLQLKQERVLPNIQYSATDEVTLTEQFKNQFDANFREFFITAYAR
jgi:hypothetical protein